MVRTERDFLVYDAKSGEDLTHTVLTQIIVEEEGKTGSNLLPIGFLRQLIRFYGHSIEQLVPKYLEFSMETLTLEQERYRKQFTDTFGAATFEAMQEQARQIWRCSSGHLRYSLPWSSRKAKRRPRTSLRSRSPTRRTPRHREKSPSLRRNSARFRLSLSACRSQARSNTEAVEGFTRPPHPSPLPKGRWSWLRPLIEVRGRFCVPSPQRGEGRGEGGLRLKHSTGFRIKSRGQAGDHSTSQISAARKPSRRAREREERLFDALAGGGDHGFRLFAQQGRRRADGHRLLDGTFRGRLRPPGRPQSWPAKRVSPAKPAAVKSPFTRSGSAKENGPGSSGPQAGGAGKTPALKAASSGTLIHSFSCGVRQHANRRRPPGSMALRMLAKAAAGSPKNMTPNREIARIGELLERIGRGVRFQSPGLRETGEAGFRDGEHLLGNIDSQHPPGIAHAPGDLNRRGAATAADFEHGHSWLQIRAGKQRMLNGLKHAVRMVRRGNPPVAAHAVPIGDLRLLLARLRLSWPPNRKSPTAWLIPCGLE